VWIETLAYPKAPKIAPLAGARKEGIVATTQQIPGIAPTELASVWVEWLRAYLGCSDDLRESVEELSEVIADGETDPDDRHAAISTLIEILFPSERVELSLEEMEAEDRKDPEKRKILEELDAEETFFADHVKAIMQHKKMTQCELAKLIGTSQPSISNLLNRQSRPQQRTVGRIAEALGVSPLELWPK